jgi:hypothetical protein
MPITMVYMDTFRAVVTPAGQFRDDGRVVALGAAGVVHQNAQDRQMWRGESG